MAEINFIFNLKEREEFIKFCFDSAFSIIPDIGYDDNSYYSLKSMEHYHDYMNESVRFFITSEKYQAYPLEWTIMKKTINEFIISCKDRWPFNRFLYPIFCRKKV